MHNAVLRHVAAQHPHAVMQPFDAIMEEFGFDAVCTIADYLGGATIYIPTKRYIFKGCLEKEITKDYLNGTTYRDLTKKYHFSERQIRRMVQ